MTTETATALPIDLPEITDEMVEYARSRATGLRSLAVGIRAALLASIPQWQPIEPDQIRAGMRIRVTVHREDCTTIYVGVAHRGGAYWCTEHGWPLTGWNYPTICEVDPSTIPADPDADLIEKIGKAIYDADESRSELWGEYGSELWGENGTEDAYRKLARVALTVIRAHDEAVTGDE